MAPGPLAGAVAPADRTVVEAPGRHDASGGGREEDLVGIVKLVAVDAGRLRADPELGAIPILALSASVMSGDPDKAFEAGCDDFEFKPVDFPQLLGKIEKLLKS